MIKFVKKAGINNPKISH